MDKSKSYDPEFVVRPTDYCGTVYRSRTEARWAVFFDFLGVEVEYEPQHFNLDGDNYLPDFWIPEWRIWMEVKGGEPSEFERVLCDRLAAKTNNTVLLTHGAPGRSAMEVFTSDWLPDEKYPLAGHLMSCRRCDTGFVLSCRPRDKPDHYDTAVWFVGNHPAGANCADRGGTGMRRDAIDAAQKFVFDRDE